MKSTLLNNKNLVQVKWEVFKKFKRFSLQSAACCGAETCEGWGLELHLPMKLIIVEMLPLTASYKTHKYRNSLHAISILCVHVFFSTFHFRIQPAATCLHLRYLVSYTEIEHWHGITFEDGFLKIKTLLP